jgi:hypothetical protein
MAATRTPGTMSTTSPTWPEYLALAAATISEAAVQRFADTIQALEGKGQAQVTLPPCAPGDWVNASDIVEAFQRPPQGAYMDAEESGNV